MLPLSSLQSFCWKTDSLMEVLLFVTNCFIHAPFKIHSLSLTLDILIIICLSVGVFEYVLFKTLWESWIWMHVLFLRIGTFLAIISLIKFSTPFFLPSLSENPIIWVLVCLILSYKSPKLSSQFFFFFFCCSNWMSSTALSLSSLNLALSSSSLNPCTVFFSLSIVFSVLWFLFGPSLYSFLFVKIFTLFFHCSSELREHYLKSLSGKLLIFISLTFFWGFILIFCLKIVLFFFIFLDSLCWFVCIR